MSKLARLVEVASNVLGVPEKTVRSRVMLLRKNSLWSSIGKGISPDPAPSDASNLLLSFLGGGLYQPSECLTLAGIHKSAAN